MTTQGATLQNYNNELVQVSSSDASRTDAATKHRGVSARVHHSSAVHRGAEEQARGAEQDDRER